MRRKSAPVISPIPAWIGGLGALAFAYLVVPLVLMGMRVPWGRLPELLTTEAALAALALSVKTALIALALDLLFGIPAAILLSRTWREHSNIPVRTKWKPPSIPAFRNDCRRQIPSAR